MKGLERMKKFLSLLLTLAILAGMCTIPAFAEETEAPAKVNAELASLEFTSGGNVISGPVDGTVKAKATVMADGAEKVSLYLVAYGENDGISSIDLAAQEFAGGETKIIETANGVDAASSSKVRAFVWKSSLEPVCEDVELGSQAVLTEASINVGGYTYDGVVDSESKKVTFYVPSGRYLAEVNALKGQVPPAVTPEVDSVSYSLSAIGSASVADGANEDGTYDADKVSKITVVSADGKTTQNYDAEYKFVLAERRYDATDASYSNGYFTQLNAGNAKSGNISDAVVTVAAKAQEGDSFSVETENGNAFARMVKTNATKPNNIQFRGSTIGDLHENAFVKTSFRFRVSNFIPTSNGAFAYIQHSGTDQGVLVATGSSTYTIYARANGSNSMGSRYEYCPDLNAGQWYEYTSVYERGDYDKGYIVKTYIDGKYIGSSAQNADGALITFDRGNGGIDLLIAAFSKGVMTLDVDDVESFATIRNDEAASKPTLHILGDSIARWYASNSKNQQGWGPVLTAEFDLDKINVLNHSVGGYNSNIYLNGANRSNLKSDPIWQSIKRNLKSGDFVMIAIGRNEKNTEDGTNSTAALKANLKIFADDCKALGVTPIFVNALPERDKTNNTDGTVTYIVTNWLNNGSGFRAAKDVKNFATENGCTMLDLNAAFFHALADKSSDEITSHFLTDDGIHISEKGAALASELLVKLINESDCSLKDYFAVPYDANYAYVKSATATVNGVTYKADVNHDSKTIMFESVILPTATEYPDLSNVEVAIEANGTSSLESVVDLTSNKTFTVTLNETFVGSDGKEIVNVIDSETYTIGFDKAVYVRTYNAQAGVNMATNHTTAARRGAPGYDRNTKGEGTWFVQNQIYSAEGVFDEAKSAGTVNVQTDSQKSSNKVIKLNKTVSGKALNFSSSAGQSAASNSKIAVEFKVRVNDLKSANSNAQEGCIYINTSNLDQILITRMGAQDGKYFIGYRPNGDDNAILSYPGKELNFGEWHTVKYVFRKNAALASGYTMELYLDGEFVTETDFKNTVTPPTGCLKSSATAFDATNAQIAVRTFSNTLADVDFDDFVITAVVD